jgi:hypothetical protein
MSVVVVISQHLLNVFVQLANIRGFKKKKFFKLLTTYKFATLLSVTRRRMPSDINKFATYT